MEKWSEETQALLWTKAQEAQRRAHAPYSKLMIGAALWFGGDRVVAGCNVENASFGLTICAERTAAVRAVAEGMATTPLQGVLIVADSQLTPPCGACRQVLWEFGHADTYVQWMTEQGEMGSATLGELLPSGFELVRASSAAEEN